MSYRPHHEWVPGAEFPARIPGAVLPTLNALGSVAVGAMLAVCMHCETLRVTEASRTSFVRRVPEHLGRVLDVPPPCLKPPRYRPEQLECVAAEAKSPDGILCAQGSGPPSAAPTAPVASAPARPQLALW